MNASRGQVSFKTLILLGELPVYLQKGTVTPRTYLDSFLLGAGLPDDRLVAVEVLLTFPDVFSGVDWSLSAKTN